MKYLTIKKCSVNGRDPFFHLAAPEIFKKSFRRNMVAKKFLAHLNGEIDTVIHNGDEYFMNKSYFRSCWDTPVYLVTKNDDPRPIGFFYLVKTDYINNWVFEDGLIIKYDNYVEKYGYTVKQY